MKEIIKKHTGAILAILFIIVLLLIIAIFGGTIMKLFGFEYEGIGSVFMFFILVGAIGAPIEMLAKALPNALLSLNKISLNFARGLFLVLDTSTL